ncbi:hypothetical protein DAPPUDRAFT_253079 [Daphnia pulex]|uniref:Uncharacterized protein n=1 Tax=Daphnia pulex TaxID=6669 RepID=E9H448_DAPPU|nr:hypothetical protein DAPPUDRAFT_253079 [Daphnia pulex]|eukprot:EFX73496.1 hypothetical protein DAPPUDRAFT_253079 [Daphnia pulex]
MPYSYRQGLPSQLKNAMRNYTNDGNGVAEATSKHPNSEETELQLKKAFGDTVTLKDSTIKTVTQTAPVFEWDKLRSLLESHRTRSLLSFQLITVWELTTSGGHHNQAWMDDPRRSRTRLRVIEPSPPSMCIKELN